MVPKAWGRVLYAMTAINPVISVFANDYSVHLRMPFVTNDPNAPKGPTNLVRTYGTLFYFARFKPRVAFTIGTMLRALQLTTAFQFVFDPVAGVGAGLNLVCLFAESRWPAAIVLGWSVSKYLWRLLGASPPSGGHVPITLSLPRLPRWMGRSSEDEAPQSTGIDA